MSTSATSYRGKTILPRYAFIDGKLEENVPITVDNDGIITEIGGSVPYDALRFEHEVFLPGFVNAHSHAFHRHLRGKSGIGGKSADTFWKWRDNMYALVDGITTEKLYEYCYRTFREMLEAGITTVGEFHYVHHGTSRFDLDTAVLRAAQDAGIRMTLIQTFYEHASFDQPLLHPVQERFVSSFQEFIDNLNELLKFASQTVTIAVAAHSARAVGFDNIKKLYNYALERNLAFHIHMEEQPKEIDDCMRFIGEKKGPSDVLLEILDIGPLFSAVHATYTPPANMKKFTQHGANVVICPCTEGYLGDGIPHIVDNQHISFGTDCNNRISFLEEMRWACYSQQMRHNSRSVGGLSAVRLLHNATMGGARSLSIDKITGSIEVGKQLDYVSFDLNSPVLTGLDADTLIDGIVLSCGNREISKVVVAGIAQILH
uniref:Amidohydro-rel domain-containing protein n=1 Tax=Haemonchus contortus TaxID=6289 RepID=A0A7I4YPP7_HAECO|nr:Amidohydrolase 1 domain containing protein [Haemonchus contortus]